MIIDILLEKITLGQIPDKEFFHNYKLENDSTSQTLADYQARWEKIIEWRFIGEHLHSNDILIEIQGHNVKRINLLTTNFEKHIPIDLTLKEWKALLYYCCLKAHVAWNHVHPFVSFSSHILNRPCRMTLIHESLLGSENPCSKFFIRFHHHNALELDDFIEPNAPKSVIPLLQKIVSIDKLNVLICGSTGSGKTSLLKSLASTIDPKEHLVTIEDTEELKLNHPKVTSFLCHQDSNSLHNKSLEDLCSYSLRVTPDRLILGEIPVLYQLFADDLTHSNQKKITAIINLSREKK